ncbi:MAG: hypothetical protein IGS03_06585 [Candidatus Sericytochromatia bacterium]|nr:hypothetical protein [Candidatus Sericytochromatia bacterium]
MRSVFRILQQQYGIAPRILEPAFLKELIARGCPVSEFALLQACKLGAEAVMSWLKAHGAPISSELLYAAQKAADTDTMASTLAYLQKAESPEVFMQIISRSLFSSIENYEKNPEALRLVLKYVTSLEDKECLFSITDDYRTKAQLFSETGSHHTTAALKLLVETLGVPEGWEERVAYLFSDEVETTLALNPKLVLMDVWAAYEQRKARWPEVSTLLSAG